MKSTKPKNIKSKSPRKTKRKLKAGLTKTDLIIEADSQQLV